MQAQAGDDVEERDLINYHLRLTDAVATELGNP